MQQYVRRILVSCLLVLSGIYLTGCTTDPIAEDLSQTQATTIVATLSQVGIPAQASHESGAKGRYTVTVKHQWYNQAVTVLHERGLPKQEEMSFADTVAARGFLPSSREIEALKIDRAQAAEIEEAIRILPAVQQVRVIVRRASVPEGGVPAVSVVAETKENSTLTGQDLEPIVTKAIPGVLPENISISLVAAQPIAVIKKTEGVESAEGRTMYVPLAPFLGYWRVADGDVSGLSLALLIGLLIIGSIGAFLGYWYGYLQQTRMLVETTLPEIPRPYRQIERVKRVDEEEGSEEV